MRRGWGLLVVASLTLLGGCDGPPAKQPEVRPVRTVIRRPQADRRRPPGRRRGARRATRAISASASAARSSRALVDVGVSVKKGDVLARLDEQDYRNRLKSAAGRHRRGARPCSIEAQGAEGRLRQLLGTGTTTRANYDAALKNLRSAEAKLDCGQGRAATWPRTSSATPSCAPTSTASSRRSAPSRARSSTSARWSSAWRGRTRRTPCSPSPSRPSAASRATASGPRSSSRC